MGDVDLREESPERDSTAPARDAQVMPPRLGVGSEVCVWNSYLEEWTKGFAVAEVLGEGYRLRRLSDGHQFDHVFPVVQVMRERRQIQLPGYTGHVDRRHHAPDEDAESAAGPPRLCQ